MRLRNIKNKEEILNNNELLIRDRYILEKNKGKWQQVFNNNNPIYLEIGMGKGKFIIDNAKKYPSINFIGIEKYDNVVARIPVIEEDIKNLIFIRMDALDIDKVFSKEIDRIYLNFSDPWPKDRHEKRRLTSRNFLEKYDSLFKKNKEIFLKTDNEDLYNYSLETLRDYGYNISLENKEENITTDYEEKFIKEGKKILFLKAQKKD